MISAFKELMTTNIGVVIIGIVVILVVADYSFKLYDGLKARLGVKTKTDFEEDRLVEMEKRIEELESTVKDYKTNFRHADKEFSGALNDLKDIITGNIVRTNRALLLNISNDALKKKYLTQIEYETFCDLADEYEKYKGNHSMKDKIIPAVKKLDILTEEELQSI